MENSSQLIIYQTESGETRLEVRLEDETVWLTQRLMAELFQTTPQNITMHLGNIFEEGELTEAATCKDFLQVRQEGVRQVERLQKFYNLDDRNILDHAGKITHQLAVEKAEIEYERFDRVRKSSIESDFDKAIKKLPKLKAKKSSD